MSDALRREVAPHGVRVVVVEPGDIATPIWEKGHADADRMLRARPGRRRRYGDLIDAVRRATGRLAEDGLPPEAVADVVAKAVTAQHPRARYVVGRQAQVHALMARLLPDRAFEARVARYLRR